MIPLHEKIASVFRHIPGANITSLVPSHPAHSSVIAESLAESFDTKRAQDIAFHLTDWTSDAAFLVALSLRPDVFTKSEIEQGLMLFLVHAPNHIAAAAKLSDNPIQDVFKLGVLTPD
jgi:hypothetical protein